nr:RNA-directed DNA polymerase, eukaryota [Tanacetum cinerariifolium]
MRNLMKKLKFLKIKIREWNFSHISSSKVEMKHLQEELNRLDTEIKSESLQKAKIKWSVEGDENSHFFHRILNKRRKQMSIRGVMKDGVWLDKPDQLKEEFLNHFRDRFSRPVENRVSFDMEFPNSLSRAQKEELESDVTREEIKRAVWDCGVDKSPCPDGFTFGFYRQFWDLVEKDVISAVNYFFKHVEFSSG